ncbi:MAG: hypothetical protein FJX56_01325 [Alphaproteobacteria bacterium]|nr:hypothetical protein [Alphaproteobacteria bacterium]
MIVRWSTFLVFYYVYRTAISVFAQASLSNLGDVRIYQRGGRNEAVSIPDLPDVGAVVVLPTIRQLGIYLSQLLGSGVNLVVGGNPYIVNLAFQTLAFAGLCRLLMAFEPAVRKRVALLVLLPSFNLWTSVASKEALLTALFCFLLAPAAAAKEWRLPVRLPLMALVLLIALLKPYYVPGIAFLIGATWLGARVKQAATMALGCFLVSLTPLLFVADELDAYARTVATHFRVNAMTLTREKFFVAPGDILVKAPEGMFQSFFGPTLREAMTGPLQMLSFVESALLVGGLVFLLVRRIAWLRAFEAIVAAGSLFWLLFASYPFGIMNAGSAVRYRAGYVVFVIAVIALAVSHLYRWQRRPAAGAAFAPLP